MRATQDLTSKLQRAERAAATHRHESVVEASAPHDYRQSVTQNEPDSIIPAGSEDEQSDHDEGKDSALIYGYPLTSARPAGDYEASKAIMQIIPWAPSGQVIQSAGNRKQVAALIGPAAEVKSTKQIVRLLLDKYTVAGAEPVEDVLVESTSTEPINR